MQIEISTPNNEYDIKEWSSNLSNLLQNSSIAVNFNNFKSQLDIIDSLLLQIKKYGDKTQYHRAVEELLKWYSQNKWYNQNNWNCNYLFLFAASELKNKYKYTVEHADRIKNN